MYKKKLDPSNVPELKSIYDNDLEKSVFDKADFIDNSHDKQGEEHHEKQEQEGEKVSNVVEDNKIISNVEEGEKVISNVGEEDKVISNVGEGDKVISNVGEDDKVISNVEEGISSSSSEKSITFNRIKRKVVRKYMLIKNKIKTSSIDYKLDLINEAINKINSRINLLEIKVNNLELDVNKNKNELLEYDRITTIEMTNINDKLNNANIIILD
jgi:hypothetical protein